MSLLQGPQPEVGGWGGMMRLGGWGGRGGRVGGDEVGVQG